MKNTTSKTLRKDTEEWLSVVKFWASWCWPCKLVAPIFEEVDKETDWVKFFEFELNDENSIAITVKYWINSVPTVLFFKDWKVEWEVRWIFNKATIESEINKLKKLWTN